MDLNSVMAELEESGTEQNRITYQRRGVLGPQFGVSSAVLKTMAKQIKKAKPLEQRQDLALSLWATGNYDARVLALMVAEPSLFSQAELEALAKDLDNYMITDYFGDLASRTNACQELAEKWMEAEDEWLGRAGWHMLAQMAMSNPRRPDAEFEPYLKRIEAEIHTSKNWVRHGMNNALIAIGARSPHLTDLALAAARRIGKVHVDHGDTWCKTPDAGSYIQRTVAHRQAMEERAKQR